MLVFLLALCLAPFALAKLSPTAPVQSTVWDARRPQTVKWRDDGTKPPLNLTGKVTISLWTGEKPKQTYLAPLSANRFINPVRKEASVQFPTDVGPNGPYYFLRFDAPDSMEDAVFTGRFELTHMTGSFNKTVLAQLSSLNDTLPGSSPTKAPASSASNALLTVQTSTTSSSSSDALPLPLSSLLLAGSTALLALALA